MQLCFITLLVALVFNISVGSGAPAPGYPSTDETTQRYLVKLKSVKTMDTLFKLDDQKIGRHHLRDCIKKKFSFGDFEGFSAEFTKDIVQQLKTNPLVRIFKELLVDLLLTESFQIADITPDILVQALDIETQTDAPRHLVRLSQEEPISYDQDMEYHYDEEHQGSHVTAYVLDTGVLIAHPQFEGRLKYGAVFSGTNPQDLQGHGTHVAGIIGSATFGVAKEVNIVSVKVLDDNGVGSLSSVIEGIEFAVNDARDNRKIGVGNLSLGALRNAVLNDAIRSLYSAGLVMVVAAGNSNSDACQDSPLSSPYAIAVGSIDDRNDQVAPFSNWGSCVNIFASGVNVASLYNKDFSVPILMSGTSMSAPSVTGLIAILLDQGIKPANVAKKLYDMSIQGTLGPNYIFDIGETPNRLVFNNITDA